MFTMVAVGGGYYAEREQPCHRRRAAALHRDANGAADRLKMKQTKKVLGHGEAGRIGAACNMRRAAMEVWRGEDTSWTAVDAAYLLA